MSDKRIRSLQAKIGGPHDGALLRCTLGAALFEAGDTAGASIQLRAALAVDAEYAAAWNLLGKVCRQAGDADAAADAWAHGIAVASARGEAQAVREMQESLRRVHGGAGAA